MTTTFESRLGTFPSEAVKAPCVASTATNNALTGLQTFAAGDRVLVRSQTDPIANGIYNVGVGTWTRASDFDSAQDVANGQLVLDSDPSPAIIYMVTVTGAYTPDTTAVTFAAVISV